MVGEVLELLLTMTTYLSMIIIVFGVMQFVLAFKDEDADRKARGVMLLVTGSVMCALKPIMSMMLGMDMGGESSPPPETPKPSFDLDLSFITTELVIGVIVVVALIAIGIVYKKIDNKENAERKNTSTKGE